MTHSKLIALLLSASLCPYAYGQSGQDNGNTDSRHSLASGLTLDVETQGTLASGDFAPLWLSSNRFGMGSTKSASGYERVSAIRSEQNDSARNWHFGYGLDVALQQGSTSTVFVQQAYASAGYKKLRLTVGSKETPLDIKNPELSSGSLSMGINAHPIPQVKLEIDYFSIPGTRQCWKWKVSGSYGMTTDGNWQRDFSAGTQNRYTSSHLYHEKRIYWKFGKEYAAKCPLTFEIGLRMATQFGGTSYNVTGRNHLEPSTVENGADLKSFWRALTWGGSDATDGTEKNSEGNQLGSYNMALAWTTNDWMVRAYAERYFDDQSMITFQYGVQDHLVGLETQLPHNKFVTGIVLEHMSTRNQSGAVYHDQSASIPDKMNGRDNYYNNNVYDGWQHWGMAIGNPLLTSPLYNTNGSVYFYNNRVKAWHLGLSGDPTSEIHWRALLSLTENWGTYDIPFAKKELQQYCMAEVSYSPIFNKGVNAWAKGWTGKLALGYDHGGVIGNSFGGQLTIHKSFNLVK